MFATFDDSRFRRNYSFKINYDGQNKFDGFEESSGNTFNWRKLYTKRCAWRPKKINWWGGDDSLVL
jgi:hypothetical protein